MNIKQAIRPGQNDSVFGLSITCCKKPVHGKFKKNTRQFLWLKRNLVLSLPEIIH